MTARTVILAAAAAAVGAAVAVYRYVQIPDGTPPRRSFPHDTRHEAGAPRG